VLLGLTCAGIITLCVFLVEGDESSTSPPPLPPPMTVAVFACNLVAPRQLTPAYIDGVGDVLFVGSRRWRQNTSVVAIVELDGVANKVITIDTGLDQPNGVEWLDGTLYVATARALFRYEGVVDALRELSEYTRRTLLNSNAFPMLASLQWHYLRGFGGLLYASNSAGCDHCVPSSAEAAAIVRLDPATCFRPSVHAAGMRFSVGFAFSSSGELFFTNNAHDSVEGDEAWDTINRAPRAGLNFGFPFCFVTTTSSFWNASVAAELIEGGHTTGYQQQPLDHTSRVAACEAYSRGVAIGDHIAPLGVSFRSTESLLIAERGAFGGPPAGHQISTISANLTGYEPLITGFLNATSGASWGRPVDVQMVAGGADAFFVSDDKSNSILRFVGSL